jgi:uncharacterized protein (DUF1015 family)
LADVRPFRALTYDPARVDLSRVLCAPYDVINPAQQAEYYDRDPHNAVRIVLARGDGDQRYRDAARDLEVWLAAGILVRAPEPAFLVHRHTFGVGGETVARLGLIAAVALEPWQTGAVRPHERTMPVPKEDRLQLMRATHADTEPIWVFHPDPRASLGEQLAATAATPPHLAADFIPASGGAVAAAPAEKHELWRLDDRAGVEDIRVIARRLDLYIADGHHRYETALFHAEEADGGPDAATRFKVMLLTALEDPGLLVLPTHRLVKLGSGHTVEGMLHTLVEGGWTAIETGSLTEVERRLAAPASAGRVGFGLYAAGQITYLEGTIAAPEEGPAADLVAPLDVALIHEGILKPFMGVGSAEQAAGDVVAYTRDPGEVIARVDAAEFDLGILLRPPTLEQVKAVADAGGSMPQKSTYFWPKPASGLVMALQPPGEDL